MNRNRKFLAVISATLLWLSSGSAIAAEPAFVVGTDATDLQWGPCPEFFPVGCQIAVLHGDPGKANADIFFKVPAGYTIPPHTHTSAERMVLVSGTLRVNYDGQDEAVIQTGNYAYGPPERPHEAYCETGDACILFIAFEQPIDAFPLKKP